VELTFGEPFKFTEPVNLYMPHTPHFSMLNLAGKI